MVNRGGPSFSNDHSARRDKTPIQLTVAFPARLSPPPPFFYRYVLPISICLLNIRLISNSVLWFAISYKVFWNFYTFINICLYRSIFHFSFMIWSKVNNNENVNPFCKTKCLTISYIEVLFKYYNYYCNINYNFD